MAELLSEQLRQAIRDCGTTRYALARQIGIAESTLSRFLSGERGLTLDVLDKLADILGLQIVVTVQIARRPSKRGPKLKPEKTKMVKIVQKRDWNQLARGCAMDASENNFSSRRGIYPITDTPALCVYNNNPYAANPSLREEETASFRKWLKKHGIKELAFSTYPEHGEEAGYTYAMLIDAPESRQAEIGKAMTEIVLETHSRASGG